MPETKCGFNDGQVVKDGPIVKGADLLVAHGPTLFVDIGFDPQFTPATVNPPQLAATKLWALVDSGATESCIDDALALQLALPIVDRRSVSGISGVKEVDMYLAHIHVPALGFTIYGAFAGVDLKSGGSQHFALIGRTFLRHFKMVYEGLTGTVTISK